MTDLFTANPQNVRGAQVTVHYDELPDQCPVCHSNVAPKLITAAFAGEAHQGFAHLVLQCTRGSCQAVFVGLYRYATDQRSSDYYTLFAVRPKTPRSYPFSEPITQLSPTFVEVYNQAMGAEAYELDQIVGIGLRKALEFLLKDFAIREHPDEEASIRTAFLGGVIAQYIDDKNIKAAAKRATWLGNDEAHYTRRWDSKDIDDLKVLVRLSVNWVENVLLTEKYVQDMSE